MMQSQPPVRLRGDRVSLQSAREGEDESDHGESRPPVDASAPDAKFRMWGLFDSPPKSKVLTDAQLKTLEKDLKERDVFGDGVLSVAEILDAPTTTEGRGSIKEILEELAELQNVERLEEYNTIHINDILGRTETQEGCKRFCQKPSLPTVCIVLSLVLCLVLLCTGDKIQHSCISDLKLNGVAYRRLSHEEFPKASDILVINDERFIAADVCPEHWTFIDGVYFIVGTIFGVGYGDLVPRNMGLKIFLVLFILVTAGFLLNAVSLIAVSLFFKTKAQAEDILKKGDLSLFLRPIAVAAFRAMMVYMVVVIVGSVAMMSLEDWTMRQSLYWAVVTCVKLGYGDIVPSKQESKAFAATYIVVVFIAMALSFLGIARAHVLVMVLRQGAAELKRPRSLRPVADLACAASDHVDQGDFLAAMLLALGKLKPGEADPILRLFRQLDVNGNGTLESRELQVFRQQHLTCRALLMDELSLAESSDKAEEKALHRPLPPEIPLDPTIHKFLSKCAKCSRRQKEQQEETPDQAEKRMSLEERMQPRARSNSNAEPGSRSSSKDSNSMPEQPPSSQKPSPTGGSGPSGPSGPQYLSADEDLNQRATEMRPSNDPSRLPPSMQEFQPPPATQTTTEDVGSHEPHGLHRGYTSKIFPPKQAKEEEYA